MQETQIGDMGLIPCSGDPQEEDMKNSSNILARKATWIEEPGGLQSMGLQRVGHKIVSENTQTHTNTTTVYFLVHISFLQGFPVAQLIKSLPAMRETLVWSLDWEDPLEKGKATHSRILA